MADVLIKAETPLRALYKLFTRLLWTILQEHAGYMLICTYSWTVVIGEAPEDSWDHRANEALVFSEDWKDTQLNSYSSTFLPV